MSRSVYFDDNSVVFVRSGSSCARVRAYRSKPFGAVPAFQVVRARGVSRASFRRLFRLLPDLEFTSLWCQS